MATIREEALAYSPPITLNIADLEVVNIDDLEIKEKEGKNSEGEVFKYRYVVVKDKEYRIPPSVLEEIQTIINLKPEVKSVKVLKSGSGLGTRYRVQAL